jgi:tRNA threonylcarbamoyladenosine biosynthesis protein TsaE
VPTLQTIQVHLSQLPELAIWLTVQLKAGDIITLDGPLGAGKTTFSRAVGKTLGLPEDSLTSPTFTLVNEYLEGRLPFLHADLYRLGQGEASDRFVEELLDRQAELGAVLWVEWASLSPALMAQASVCLQLSFSNDGNERESEVDFEHTVEAENIREFEILPRREDWTLWDSAVSPKALAPSLNASAPDAEELLISEIALEQLAGEISAQGLS